jgi:hypothetical protein
MVKITMGNILTTGTGIPIKNMDIIIPKAKVEAKSRKLKNELQF